MEAFFLDEIAGERKIGRRHLPFGFRGQARAGPTRVRIGLEITHMTDRLGRIYFAQTGQGEVDPLTIGRFPIQGRWQFLVFDREQARRKPELRRFVAAVSKEIQIFAIRDESLGKLDLFIKYAMPRSSVVKGKIFSVRK